MLARTICSQIAPKEGCPDNSSKLLNPSNAAVIPESAINLVKQISLSIDQIEHISLENN